MASKHTRRLVRTCWLLAAVVALAGCGKEEPLRVYVTAATPRPQVLEIPSTWRPVPRRQMDPTDVLYKFEAGGGDDAGSNGKVQINISISGGDLLANVNRWRGQPGILLRPLAESELLDALKPLQIDEYRGYCVELVGPETQPKIFPENAAPKAKSMPWVRSALYGAIIPAKGRQWFFRLIGPVAAAEKEKANFKAFVETGLRAIAAAAHEPKPEAKSAESTATE